MSSKPNKTGDTPMPEKTGRWAYTSSIVAGDRIQWTEPVWGAYSRYGRRQPPIGERTVEADVIRESYGSHKQQHTFTLRVASATGDYAQESGEQLLRKGRNLYGNDLKRQIWTNEAARNDVCDEKYERGEEARQRRDARRDMGPDIDLSQ